MPQKFYLATFGCRVNQADSAALKLQMERLGLRQSDDVADSSVIVVNSCTVTHRSDQQVRQLVRRLRRANPAARLVVTGCYAQRDPAPVAQMAEVDLVLGNLEKERIGEFLGGRGPGTGDRVGGKRNTEGGKLIGPPAVVRRPLPALSNPQQAVCDGSEKLNNLRPSFSQVVSGQWSAGQPAGPQLPVLNGPWSVVRGLLPVALPSYFERSKVFVSELSQESEIEAQPVTTLEGKTRPYLKIQEGCDSRCSYCIVPFVRGPGRSVPPASVVAQASELVDQGYKEIVLTGIHLGSYGSKLKPRTRLEELLLRLFDVPGLQQIRLSAIEPMRFSRRLIDLAQQGGRLAPHFHLPLLSGSDAILRRMNRSYRSGQFADLVNEIHERLPHASIGTDVIVGFPGETEGLFEETRRFIERLPFSYLHVFPFSPRSGTPAATMTGQVRESDKSRRVEILRGLSVAKLRAFEDRFLGKTLKVLILRERQAGCWTGLSENYLKVKVPTQYAQANEFVSVTVERWGGALYGIAVP